MGRASGTQKVQLGCRGVYRKESARGCHWLRQCVFAIKGLHAISGTRRSNMLSRFDRSSESSRALGMVQCKLVLTQPDSTSTAGTAIRSWFARRNARSNLNAQCTDRAGRTRHPTPRQSLGKRACVTSPGRMARSCSRQSHWANVTAKIVSTLVTSAARSSSLISLSRGNCSSPSGAGVTGR
jgi:hypothetical protein